MQKASLLAQVWLFGWPLQRSSISQVRVLLEHRLAWIYYWLTHWVRMWVEGRRTNALFEIRDKNRRWSVPDTILGILSCCYRGVIPATIVKVTVVQWSRTSRVAQLRWRCHNLWTVGNVIVCPGTLALVHCWCNWHVCYFISALPATTCAIQHQNALLTLRIIIHCQACKKTILRPNLFHTHARWF